LIYNLRKLTHGLTIPPVRSSLMRRLETSSSAYYTLTFIYICLSIFPLTDFFIYRHFCMCVFLSL